MIAVMPLFSNWSLATCNLDAVLAPLQNYLLNKTNYLLCLDPFEFSYHSVLRAVDHNLILASGDFLAKCIVLQLEIGRASCRERV